MQWIGKRTEPPKQSDRKAWEPSSRITADHHEAGRNPRAAISLLPASTASGNPAKSQIIGFMENAAMPHAA